MKQILVPYDFSENAMLALDVAIQMATDEEVSLKLVYVFEFKHVHTPVKDSVYTL